MDQKGTLGALTVDGQMAQCVDQPGLIAARKWGRATWASQVNSAEETFLTPKVLHHIAGKRHTVHPKLHECLEWKAALCR